MAPLEMGIDIDLREGPREPLLPGSSGSLCVRIAHGFVRSPRAALDLTTEPPAGANVLVHEAQSLLCRGEVRREGDVLAMIEPACNRFAEYLDTHDMHCEYDVARIELRIDGERLHVTAFDAPLPHGCSALTTTGLHVDTATLTRALE